jgi:hypothetical protein
MKILIFSEEYIKITKGMFVIWMNHPCEASKRRQVDILLNHEHWALDEAKEVCQANAQVAVHSMPFNMPRTPLKRVFAVGDSGGYYVQLDLAAARVHEVWDDVDGWWGQSVVQEA